MNPNNGDMLHAAMHAESNHSIKSWLPACIVAWNMSPLKHVSMKCSLPKWWPNIKKKTSSEPGYC